MRNTLANFPGLKSLINYWFAIRHKLKSEKLLIGNNNELREVSFGQNVALGNKVSIFKSKVDSYTYISEGTLIRNTKIGKFCAIGPYCQIGLGKHPVGEFISSHPLFYSNRSQIGFSLLKESRFTEFEEINIGNDVWIGAGAIVLDGVTIGDGAVIAAGAIVLNDVEPFSIVAGVPAKHKKYKFSNDKIKTILSDPWWKKEMDWIKQNIIQ